MSPRDNIWGIHRIPPYWMLDSKSRTIDELRTIVEKVERKAHVPTDNPDVVALKTIVEERIAKLEHDDKAAAEQFPSPHRDR